MSMTSKDYDIAIIGGGMVGASLALALSQNLGQNQGQLKVAVVEKFAQQANKAPKLSGYDDRTLVLNPVSCQILNDLGLQSLIEEAIAIHSIHVSDKGRFGRTLLHADDYHMEWFGKVVEAHRLGHQLLETVQTNKNNIDWLAPAGLEKITREAGRTRLTLKSETNDVPSEIRARLIIGADGAQSKVRSLFGLPTVQYDYQQTAITCNATPSKSHSGCAFERFTENGPLAILPQAGRRVGVVMITSTTEAERLLEQNDADFMAVLQQQFGYRLGFFQRVGQRSHYPLHLVRAEKNVAEGCLLIGNASHSIHPVSAQGFNLGLRDVSKITQVLTNLDLQHADLAELAFVENLQQCLQQDQDDTIRYTDTLARLFTNPSLFAGAIRSTSLLGHQLIPSLQRRLVNSAMGYR